ncbi:hypothetical protein [Actinokineospora iranica]|uniref:Cellulase (Glycosyl hydrolase family 5) n=1 Tax=Actinokineospora iranica TaxID=1271860 RepID=A0A1G6V9N3_9PSEU|nr:hypothetical protein [Actinokineospora iranica]SDD50389.1 hypothetical protein SAMN05216174_11216 [Actinokineospora iranica]
MSRLPLLLLSAALATGFLTVPAAASGTSVTVERGGSNYAFYQIDRDADGACDREPYGVVNSFDKAPATIAAQLARMHANGQRRLRLAVFHQHGPDSGTVMDSTGGNLSPRNRRNLADLLAVVKATGFAEVEVGFFPIGAADPHGWAAWDETLYQENRDLIDNVREIVRAADLPYRLDLLNEGMPMSDQPVLLDYTRRLWADYTARHGKADTVGFSMTVWIAGRARQIPAVYGDTVPDVFDIHLYRDDWTGDEHKQFVEAHHEFAAQGYHQPWIIGEALYDDGTAATGIARAIGETGRGVLYLTQWQLSAENTCADRAVDVAPPAEFGRYAAAGF